MRCRELTLLETIDNLQSYHRKAPFLFFNGNTFADIGRRISDALFADLHDIRRRELTSAMAHYIAGVLDRESMISAVESLCEAAAFRPGDSIQTLRGTTRGVIVRILDDGQVVWKPEGSDTELTTLPEGLRPA